MTRRVSHETGLNYLGFDWSWIRYG